jgi:hypothetical protein
VWRHRRVDERSGVGFAFYNEKVVWSKFYNLPECRLQYPF